MGANIEEYKMLRTEILQYLQHYQNIRTFMFTSTTAIFTFLFKSETREPLMYLLPLLVVIPAYLSAVNYWLCVTVDAAYLIVFHEGQKGFKGLEENNFNWETRHSRFGKLTKSRKHVGYSWLIENIQPLAYILVSMVCFIAYGYLLYLKVNGTSVNTQLLNTVGVSVDIVIGVISFIICFFLFVFVRVKEKDSYVAQWRMVKDEEVKP